MFLIKIKATLVAKKSVLVKQEKLSVQY